MIRLISTFFIACFSTSVLATVIYDVDASSSFTLIDADDLMISAEAGLEMPMTDASGSGIATIDADFQSDPALFPGSSLLQSSEVSGSAGPSPGSSDAASLNSFLIILENVTDMAKTAVFEFTYDWDVSISQAPMSDADLEASFGSAFFHLTGFAPSGGETLAIDDLSGAGIVAVPDWLFNPVISFEFSDVVTPGAMTGSTTVLAYVTVPAFSTDSFSVITDAFGAASRISEPGLGLLLSLLVIWVCRRSKVR